MGDAAMDGGAEKVESLDELLMEILLWLPPKSVYKFRCVSKRWMNIIYNPFFIKSYSERWLPGRGCGSGGGGSGGRLLGFIQGRSKYVNPRRNPRPVSQPAINMLPAAGILNNMVMNCIPSKLGYFVNSSDGLILCGRHPKTYNVLNPITRQWVPLPAPPNNDCDIIAIGLICDEAEIRVNDAGQQEKIANYGVLRAGIPMDTNNNTLCIQTYTSKTRVWVESTLVGTDPFTLSHFMPPLVLNGFFNWHVFWCTIAVYDTNYGNHLQLIQLPNDGRYSRYIITRSNRDDGDVLWFGYRNTRDCLEFWMLPKGKSGSYYRSTTIPRNEWKLIYAMRDDSLYNDCGLINTEEELFGLEAFIPWNPIVVVLRFGKTVFLYNLKNKSVESVSYLGCCVVGKDGFELKPYLDSPLLSSLLF